MTTQRLPYWLVTAVLLTVIVLLTGCGSSSSQAMMTGASWPGVTVDDDTIYIAFSAHVYAVDPQTNDAIWVFPTEAQSTGSFFGSPVTFYAAPAVRDDLVVVLDYNNTIYGLDRVTGAERWTFKANGRFIGGAVISQKYVYAGAADGILYALDRENGAAAWTFKADRGIWATPLLDEASQRLYVTSLDRHLYALDAESGELLWQYPAEGESSDPPMGAIVCTPTLHDGVLYFGSLNNILYALDTETRQVLWTYPTANWVWSAPTFDEASGRLIGGDLDGHVFALDSTTGDPIWTFEAEGPVVGAPVLGDLANGTRVAYVTSVDTYLYILKVEDGTKADTPVSIQTEFTTRFLFVSTGTVERPIPIYAPPVLYDDLILIPANQGGRLLIALDRETLLERGGFTPPTGR